MFNLILKKQNQLVVNNGFIKRLYQGNTSKLTDNLFNKKVPETVLPSENFLKTLEREKDKQNFYILAGQLNIFYERLKSVPKVLNDDDWIRLIRMDTVTDRESFLCSLYYDEINKSPKMSNEKISEINKQRYDNGEMVYARYYHQLIDCYGSDFRERINKYYGYNYYSSYRNKEEIPKLLIDCRHLYKLSLSNQQGYPFDVTLTSVLTDPTLSDVIKKNFTFLYGSGGKMVEKVEEDDDGFIMPSEGSYPLRPVMTVKKSCDFYDKSLNKIAFISHKAKQNLPDDITIFDTFIIAPSDEGPERETMKIGISEKLPSFRIPIEKYVKWERGSKALNPLIIGKLLTSLYYKNMTWRNALNTHIPEFHLKPTDEDEKQAALAKRYERDRIKDVARNFTYNYKKKINLNNYGDSSKKDSNNNDNESNNLLPQKRIRIHRYSREERNKKRKEGIL